MRRGFLVAGVAVLLTTAAVGSAIAARGGPAAGDARPGLAMFEGRVVDLSRGWGEARACAIFQAQEPAECFRDVATLRAREREFVSTANELAACSSPLRLYADGGYGGRELSFYDRGYWQNLGTWSFDNQLSSYKVGACGVFLAENANGGGSWYPGSTGAGHWEPSMQSGWDNRISSIYVR